MNRRMIDEAVARLDRNGILTDPKRLIEFDTREEVLDTWATERAWNGSAYECYLCSRKFHSLNSLNQHLRSTAHAEKRYRCPSVWQGCGKEFSALSGFVQHMEKCRVHRFKGRVEPTLDDVMKGKRITQ